MIKNGSGKVVIMDMEEYWRERAEKKLFIKLQEAECAVEDKSAWLSFDELKASVGA